MGVTDMSELPWTSTLQVNLLFDLLDEGLVILDNSGAIVHSNQAFADSLQYSVGELVDRHFDDFISEEQRGILSSQMVETRGRPFDLGLITKNGKLLKNNIRILSLIEDENQKGFCLVMTEPEESGSDFEKIVSCAHLKMVTVDTDLNITYVNPAFSEDASRFIGFSVIEGVDPEYRDEFQQKLVKVINDGVNQEIEISEKHEGRPTTWHVLRIGPIKDEHGVTGAVVAGYEITDRVLAMNSLQESEEKFRGVFEHAGDAILLTDEEGCILSINKAQEKLFGINRETAIGMPVLELQASMLSEDEKTPEHMKYLKQSLSSFYDTGTAPWLEKTTPGEFVNPIDKTHKTFEQTAFRIPTSRGFMLCSFIRDTTEQNRIEEARKISENRYRALFEENNDGVVIIDLAGKTVDANSRAAEILGFDNPESMIHLPFSETVPEAEKTDSIKRFEDIMGGKTLPTYERSAVKCDGTEIIIEQTSSVVKDKEGNPIHIQIIMRDITDRKETRLTLDEVLERYELALKGADLGVWDWNAAEDEMVFSERWAEILGYSVDEIEPNYAGWEKLIHPDDIELMESRWNAHVNGVSPFYSSEHRMRTKAGGWKWVLERGRVVEWNEEGGTKRATGTLLDITERKVFEKALQQSEEKYRNLLENIPQRVFFKDTNSVYVAVNPSFASFLGVSPSEVLGKTDYDFFPEELADQYRAKDMQVLETLATLEYEEPFIEDSEERIAHTVKAPVRDDEGNIVGLIGIFWDITESKHSAEVLREQESRYRTIVEQSLMGLAIIPRGFQSIAFVNPKICDILGYTQDELLSLNPENVSALVHPDDVAQIDDYLNNRLKDKEPGEPIQIRMIHKNGSEIWGDFSAGGIEYGDVPAVQVSVIDITKRIMAETEVLRDRQVFKTIAEGAIQAKDTGELSTELLKGIISSLDFDFGTIRLYDEKNNVLRFAALEGIEISDTIQELPLTEEFGDDYIIVHSALNKTPEFISNVHDEASHKSYLMRLKSFGASSSVAYPILDDDQNLLGVLSLATHTPRTYSEGDKELFSTIVNMLGSVLERKSAEKALQISERRYRELLTNISEGMAIANLDENILFVNNSFADMLGYDCDELVGTNILDIIVEEDKEKILSQTDKRRNGESTSYTHGFVTKDGGQRIVRVSAVPSRDDDGKVDGTIAVVTDITERIQKDKEIQRLNEELAQRVEERTAELAAANKELEAFSYSVSHDLRAPLRTIDGFSQALLEDYSDSIDSTGKDFLHRVRAAANHMASLIEDLLMLSRVARAEMDRVDVNLSEIAREIIDEFQEVESEREVTVKISEDIHAHCDQRLIRLVLQNLLENAWKFTSKASDAQIEFGCIEKDEGTQFYIKDNGAGFNMDYNDKLFIPFQRLHQSEDFPGSGIGLATVQRIINRHGGKVWADSVIEEGSTFYFTIPESKGVE